MNRCIAYLDNGNICGQPAYSIDTQKGGMVCWIHSQEREVQRAEASRGLAHFDAIREGMRDFGREGDEE